MTIITGFLGAGKTTLGETRRLVPPTFRPPTCSNPVRGDRRTDLRDIAPYFRRRTQSTTSSQPSTASASPSSRTNSAKSALTMVSSWRPKKRSSRWHHHRCICCTVRQDPIRSQQTHDERRVRPHHHRNHRSGGPGPSVQTFFVDEDPQGGSVNFTPSSLLSMLHDTYPRLPGRNQPRGWRIHLVGADRVSTIRSSTSTR